MKRERLVGNVTWRSEHRTGMEYCSLWSSGNEYQFDGTVLTVCDERPFRVRYAVGLDAEWRTTAVYIDTRAGAQQRSLKLLVDADRRWWDGTAALPEFDGLDDVDLAISPCTNTLPIRRLALAIGESASVSAVWIRFPELAMGLLEQRYTRLDASTYRYESPSADRLIAVDGDGLVVDYEGLWTRVADAPPEERVN